MEKGNFVYSGWRANGFVALVGLLVLIAGGIALCVFGSDVMDPRIGLRTAMLVCGVCLFFGGSIPLWGARKFRCVPAT